MADYVDDEFEWDIGKSETSRRRRGVDFFLASQIFARNHSTRFDAQHSDEEPRYISVGVAEGASLSVVYTDRGERKRIISARAASKNEIDAFAQEFDS